MRIAIISTFYGKNFGGAEISAKILADGLQRKRHNITVLSTKKSDYGTYSINFLRFIPKKLIILGSTILDKMLESQISHYLEGYKPDIIHVQDLFVLPATVKAAKKRKIPILVTIRDELPRTYSIFGYNLLSNRNLTYKESLTKCDLVISISHFIKNSLVKFGINPKKIKVIYNIPPRWKFKKEITKEKKDNFILAPGRLFKEKGFEVVIRSLRLVVREIPNVKLIIIGDGPEKANLTALIKSYHLEDNVNIINKVPNNKIHDYFKKCSLVVFTPIYNEPLGRVAIEAAISKKPIVATNVGGIPEIVLDGKTGILVKPNRVDQLSNAILKLLKNPILSDNIGKNGYNYITKNLNENMLLDKTIRTYNQFRAK
ncbi:MAG: glycosyltransferase family 4 protein [Nanoarchaeota archaeon]|mgnify:FL=1